MKKIICLITALAALLSGCSMKRDVAMKIGDVDIKTEYVEYFEKRYNTSSGGTVSDEIKSRAANEAKTFGEYIAVGHAMGIDITDRYNSYLADLKEQIGDIEDFKKKQNISDDLFDFINYAAVYCQELLEESESKGEVTDEVTDEYFKSHFWRAKHLLLLTTDKDTNEEFSEDKQKEIKKKIEDLYEQVKAGADFDALIEEYNEDPGVKSNPEGYVYTDGEMVAEFQNGVDEIEVGEYNLVKTSYGYHIVKRLALDETPELYKKFKEENIDKISNAIVNERFEEYIASALKENDITIKDYTGKVESTETVAK